MFFSVNTNDTKFDTKACLPFGKNRKFKRTTFVKKKIEQALKGKFGK